MALFYLKQYNLALFCKVSLTHLYFNTIYFCNILFSFTLVRKFNSFPYNKYKIKYFQYAQGLARGCGILSLLFSFAQLAILYKV